jgi:hypothetical protein
MHPTATEFVCEGRAGGAIVHNSVIITVAGEPHGGPDAIQLDPPVVEFPGGGDVSACCYDVDPVPPPSQNQDWVEVDSGCRKDCARAACNRILEGLREQVMQADPSNGGCSALPDSFADDCRARVRGSLETWIAHIEANYDECVSVAAQSNNAALPFDDPAAPFLDELKLELPDSGCNPDLAGCLFGAELRPFCELDNFTEANTCEQAGNLEDELAGVEDDGGVDESSGGGSVVDPWGDLGTLVECSPQTSCLVHEELFENVATNFDVFYDEGVDLQFGTHATGVTGLKVTGLGTGEDSKDLFDAFGVKNNDVITHVNNDPLSSGPNVWGIIQDLQDVSYWEVRVRRYKCVGASCSWTTFNYDIALAVSFGDAIDPRNPGHRTEADSTGTTTGASEQDESDEGLGCGCTGGGVPKSRGYLVLFALLALRYRRRLRSAYGRRV